MSTIKGYWGDVTSGKIYVIESTTFGEVVGGAGPIDVNDLRELDDYEYKPAIVDWLKEAIAGHKMRRINPPQADKSQ